ncbi:hypothetical protein BH10PSE4_BH10PSE4_31910 [soil metagenome]
MDNDASFLAAFLRGEIDGAMFSHADHVRVGFEALQIHGFSSAVHHLSLALKTMAAKAGNPAAYHETITVAFLAVIAERSAAGAGASPDFDKFASANPDLMDKSVLAQWYTPERLGLDLARRTFLLPDLAK